MGRFDGMKGLVLGVANDHSIAWAIAKEVLAEGGQIGFSHLPDRPDDARQRKAAGYSFGNANKVGFNARMLAGEELAGTSKATLYFIADEQNAMLIGKFSKGLKKRIGRWVEATLALHRLDNERCDVGGGDINFE